MILPSKELLNEVLSNKIILHDTKHEHKDILAFRYEWREYYSKNSYETINIYKLQYMMKEFIAKNVGSVGSGYEKDNDRYWCIINGGNQQFYANSEFEAVTQACEWVRSNR